MKLAILRSLFLVPLASLAIARSAAPRRECRPKKVYIY
jgi:hypothetical protein